MTKQYIVDYITTQLPQIDKVNKYHPIVIEAACERVLNEMYLEVYKINPRLLDAYTKAYGVTTAIAIAQEAGTTIYYSTLPVRVVHVPDKASGVRHIYPVAHTGNQFMPMDATEADLIFNTDVAVVSGKIGYRTRRDNRVDYWNTNATIRSSGVRMDLLIPFLEHADSDEVPIPTIGESDGVKTFYERVLATLGVIPQVDLQDDNKDAARQKE